MSKVFRVTPKRIKRVNGQILTPEMQVVVTMPFNTNQPFINGAVEVQAAYKRLYDFDYKKACCQRGDFDVEPLD